MPIGQAQMPLFDHLNELRRRLMVILVCLILATIALYLVSDQLIFLLSQPISKYLGDMVVLDPFGGFALRFKVSLVFGLLVTCPVWIWQMLAFFLPALKPNERKWVVPTFFAAVFLFAVGMVFCYFIILDPAFNWLIGQTSGFAVVLADAQLYTNTILLFEVGFGVAFELPLAVFYLTVFNIVPYQKLRSSWRAVYIGLMLVCAMVTPDASPVTMLMMFAAMISLYEASLLVSRLVLTRRISRQRRQQAADDDD